MFKYFKDNEIIGLNIELVKMLDKAREKAQTAFVITSGLRSKEHNEEVGGVENSAHLTGLAVDIACTNSQRRYRIIKALMETGFRRIEIKPFHIHCDIDTTKEQDIIWI